MASTVRLHQAGGRYRHAIFCPLNTNARAMRLLSFALAFVLFFRRSHLLCSYSVTCWPRRCEDAWAKRRERSRAKRTSAVYARHGFRRVYTADVLGSAHLTLGLRQMRQRKTAQPPEAVPARRSSPERSPSVLTPELPTPPPTISLNTYICTALRYWFSIARDIFLKRRLRHHPSRKPDARLFASTRWFTACTFSS